MNEAQVQAFLVSQETGCTAANGMPCMKNYTETTVTRAATNQCTGYTAGASEPASRIIVKVAQSCGISPQVLLVTLQKEQALVTATAPTAAKYRIAMGYGCPDTAPCDAQYYGFYNQVYKAAWQLKEYTIHPSSWRYRIGAQAVQYHPNAACGAPVITVQNQATADLYNYTPYQPNAAALANLGGTGDGCSSYGNRNFWVYFNNWFGSPTGQINPIGSVDIINPVPGGIRLAGWALDPDTSASINIHAYVDGVPTAILASNDRPDVAALYGLGAAHGFDTVVPVPTGGTHSLCIYGINVGLGTNGTILCTTASSFGGLPIGSFDYAQPVVGGINVGGWALDPDTASATPVHVYVDSTPTVLTASGTRNDLLPIYPEYGAGHGFTATVNASPGVHTVCAYAIDVPDANQHTSLGCYSVTVPAAITDQGRTPMGWLDSITAGNNSVAVSGWAIDPDTLSSIPVHVYVDSVGTAITANTARSDVAAAYPAYAANPHGFSSTVSATPGTHNVCVYAINTGVGAHNLLGCRTVTVSGVVPITEQGRTPTGWLDSITATSTGYQAAGWALDPDTAASINIAVYVDAAGYGFPATGVRADVASAYPGYGSAHGFVADVAATAGSHNVCVYAINSVSGENPLLGCRVVTR
jgi:hypothetical protein